MDDGTCFCQKDLKKEEVDEDGFPRTDEGEIFLPQEAAMCFVCVCVRAARYWSVSLKHRVALSAGLCVCVCSPLVSRRGTTLCTTNLQFKMK